VQHTFPFTLLIRKKNSLILPRFGLFLLYQQTTTAVVEKPEWMNVVEVMMDGLSTEGGNIHMMHCFGIDRPGTKGTERCID
jgi:hypothetical protein